MILRSLYILILLAEFKISKSQHERCYIQLLDLIFLKCFLSPDLHCHSPPPAERSAPVDVKGAWVSLEIW